MDKQHNFQTNFFLALWLYLPASQIPAKKTVEVKKLLQGHLKYRLHVQMG